MSNQYHFAIDLPVEEETLYRAFTDESMLTQWLTEFAHVSIADGVFELWGRYLPDAPERPVTKFIEAVETRLVRFGMTIRSVETEVRVAFEDGGVRIEQDKVPQAEREATVEDFWGLALENLRRLATGGSGPLFRDFSETATGEARVSVKIGGSAAQVYRALTEPAQLDRYVAKKAVVEPRVGGKMDFGWGGGPIKILSLEPDREVSYSWQYGNDPETVATWTLEGSDGGTRLTLVHSGFGAARKMDDYSTGWYFFVNSLKSMVEMGTGWRRARVHAV